MFNFSSNFNKDNFIDFGYRITFLFLEEISIGFKNQNDKT